MTEFSPRSGNLRIRDAVKRLDKVIEEVFGKIDSSKPMLLTRFTMLLNMIVQIRFDNKDEPPKDYIRAIIQTSRELERRPSSDTLKFISAMFFLQYTVCKHSQNVRGGLSANECGFFYLITQSSKKFFDLHKNDFAKVGYLIASKILHKRKHQSWGVLQESIYFQLGQLELGRMADSVAKFQTHSSPMQSQLNPQEPPKHSSPQQVYHNQKALHYFIEAMNNHNRNRNSDKLIPINCEKAVFQLVGGTSKLINEEKIDLCKIICSNLKNLEFSDYVIMTEEEMTHSLNKVDGFGFSSIQTNLLASNMSIPIMSSSNSIQTNRSAPKELSSLEKASQVVQGIDKIIKILASKLSESELKPIQRKIEYNRMAVSISNLRTNLKGQFGGKSKELVSFIRSASVGEPVVYRITVKNNYFREIYDEISNIQLEFDYAQPATPENLKNFERAQILSGSELKSHISYQIGQMLLSHGEVKQLEITVTFLQGGYYRLRALNWMLFDAVPFKYEVPSYFKPDNLNYAAICVNNNAGVLRVNTENLRDKLSFGEIHKSTLILTNAGSIPIDDVYLASAEPLFTGFGIKSFGKLEPNQTLEQPFFVRGTLPKVAIIPLMFIYKTGGFWKYLTYYFEVAVKRPFSGLTFSEDMSDGKRLLTIDVIKNSAERQLDPNQMELISLKLSSNVWKIIPETFKLVKNNSMMVISIQIEKRKNINPDTLYLTRNHAEVLSE